MASLPFSISTYAGLAKTDGLLRLEGGALVLEFQIQDRVLGLLRSDIREVRIPLSEIDDIELKTGLLRQPRLVVQTETMRVSQQIPGSEHGTFELTIDKQHLLATRHLISTLQTAKAAQGSHSRPAV